MPGDLLGLMADTYRESGPWTTQFVVRDFLLLMPRAEVETQLADLLDRGVVTPADPGRVRLSPRSRVSLFSRPMLMAWLHEAGRRPTVEEELTAQLAVRAEVRELCAFCLVAAEEDGLGHRAVELAAVLAMIDLDPRAMDVASGLPGTPRAQIAVLTDGAEGSCSSISELQARARRYLATHRTAAASRHRAPL